jgi:NADPH:quinone reductase-like Zn-dependent oxidoreductase
MKAFTLQKIGGVENLTLTDLPVPTIQPNEVLIQTKAIGINPVDAFLRQHAEFVQSFMLPQPGQDTW